MYIPAALFLLLFMQLNRKFNKINAVLLMLAVLVSSCFLHYYRTNTMKQIDAQEIQELQEAKKSFILHSPSGVFVLDDFKIRNDVMGARLSLLPTIYDIYLNPRTDKPNKFHVADKDEVLAEVHLYTNHQLDSSEPFALNIHEIYRADIYTFDKSATNKSTVGSIFALVGGAALAVGIIALMVECNCPQVYACSGNECKFKGGLYSGAIYKSLERTDYMPLTDPLLSGNKLQLKIGSVQEEEQIINQVGLLQVDHIAGTNVLLDRHGVAFGYGQPLAPESVTAKGEKNLKQVVSMADGHNYSFGNSPDEGQVSDIILDFKKPVGVSSGRLVLRARNSAWSGYLMRDFKALFGNQFTAWTAKKDAANPQEMIKWQMEQSLPIIVSIEKDNHWVEVDYFSTPGNTAPRDMIMNLDLSGFPLEDHFRIRLQTAYRFWDLDYAGIDYTPIENLRNTWLPAKKMMKSDNESQVQFLQGKDGLYTHLSPKENLDLEFEVQPVKDETEESAFFLVGGGYYHYQKNYEGEPQVGELSAFLKKGAFDHFSRKKFEEWLTLLRTNTREDLSYNK